MDVVNSYRTESFVKHFHKKGLFPILITNRWEPAKNGWVIHSKNDKVQIERHKNFEIHRLPYFGIRTIDSKIWSKIDTFLHLLKGNLDPDLLFNYRAYKTYLFKYLVKNKVDLILSIFHPHNHHKLAYECGRKFSIKYVLDYQDLWDNDIITKTYTRTFKKLVFNNIAKFYWRKWLKKSIFFTTTSKIWIDYLESLSGTAGYQIRNGHDYSFIYPQNTSKIFNLVFFGRLYPNMDLDVIVSVLKRVLDLNLHNFRITLIGVKSTATFDGKEYLKSQLNYPEVYFIDYMSKEKLMEYSAENASMFFLPNFKEYNGQFMVKLYDYLILGQPVILAPTNGGELEEVIMNAKAGFVSSSQQDIFEYILKTYEEHQLNKKITYNPYHEYILSFSRKSQLKKLANLIHAALPES